MVVMYWFQLRHFKQIVSGIRLDDTTLQAIDTALKACYE